MEFLTTEETARLLRTSRSALYMQRARNALPGLLGVRMGRQLLFRRSDLDTWIEQQVTSQLADVERS
jgi:excisionase family DNA binding protein